MGSSLVLKNDIESEFKIIHSDGVGARTISSKDLMGTMLVNSIAELKLISGSNADKLEVLGYYTKGDGGGGLFYWDSASTETDNGGTIIQATGVTSGRWKRVYSDTVNVKCFGAKGDGTTDDSASIQNCLNYAYSITSRKPEIYFPNGTYISASQINFNNALTLRGAGEQNTVLQSNYTGDWGYLANPSGAAPSRTKLINLSFNATATTSGTVFFNSTYGMNEFTGCEFSHSSTGTTGIALRLLSTINLVNNCIFTCNYGSGKYGVQLDSQYNTFNNCWFDEFKGQALYIKGYYNYFTNCMFQDATQRLITFETTSHHNIFSCCYFNNASYMGGLLRNYGENNSFDVCNFITNSISNSIIESSATNYGLVMTNNKFDNDTYKSTGKGGYANFNTTLTSDNEAMYELTNASVRSITIGYQNGNLRGRITNGSGALIEHNNGDEWTLTKIRGNDTANGRIIRGTSGIGWFTGTGTPEGVVTAIVGSIYTRLDGGTSTTLYVKQSGTGNTGWVAK